MKEQLISLETSELAKEKGFEEPCYDCYTLHGNLYSNGWCEFLDEVKKPFTNGDLKPKYYLAPTQSLLQKWLREEHKIHISIWYNNLTEKWRIDYIIDILTDDEFNPGRDIGHKTYEQALEAGLLKALTLLK